MCVEEKPIQKQLSESTVSKLSFRGLTTNGQRMEGRVKANNHELQFKSNKKEHEREVTQENRGLPRVRRGVGRGGGTAVWLREERGTQSRGGQPVNGAAQKFTAGDFCLHVVAESSRLQRS